MQINPFKLERLAAEYEFSAKYMLSPADCESFTTEEILNMESGSKDAFQNQYLGYTEPLGPVSLRKQISELYQEMDTENILTCGGTEDAMFLFMNTVLNSGDHVIVQFPCFQSLIELPRAIGCEVTKWIPDEQNNWKFDIDFLRKSMTKNTKAIILTTPHNPTGSLISEDCLKQIIDIAKKYDCYIFSDEIFRFLEYKEEDRVTAACDLYENAVSAGGLSKSFGLPGLRISWIATKNRKIYEAMESYKDYTSVCNSAPSEFLAGVALRQKTTILNRNKTIVLNNLEILNDFFTKYSNIFNWNKPNNGNLIFPSFKVDVDSGAFCEELIKAKGIYLVPSTVFDYGNKNIRIGFGRKNFPEVLNLFEEFVKEKFL